MKRTPMTLRGAEALRSELKRLKSQDRPNVIKAIAEARAHGDLSENAEYHAAREQQGFIEGRIAEVEAKLSTAEIIDPSTLPKDGRVVFGAGVLGASLVAAIVSSLALAWGVGEVAPRGWKLYFKGGWGSGTGLIDSQVALLRRGCSRVSAAVLTMYDGSHAYGKATLRGLFARLLRGMPRFRRDAPNSAR